MLFKEAAEIMEIIKCKHLSAGICEKCGQDIVELLKNQSEQPIRKLIQIATLASSKFKTDLIEGCDMVSHSPLVIGLSNDGLVWINPIFDKDNKWTKLPNIPQTIYKKDAIPAVSTIDEKQDLK